MGRRNERKVKRVFRVFKVIVVLLVAAQALAYSLSFSLSNSVSRLHYSPHLAGDPNSTRAGGEELDYRRETSEVLESDGKHTTDREIESEVAGEEKESEKRQEHPSSNESETRPSRKKDIFQPCLSEKEAEQQGIYLIHSARPRGLSQKEFRTVERCWRKRRRSEPLYPAEKLPPLKDLKVRMSQDEMKNLVFIHRENVGKLGAAITDASSNTLTDLLAAEGGRARGGGERGNTDALPSNATGALHGQMHRDCAVVASGGTLQGAGLGKQIDEHEIVVRINQAPTWRSRRIVGSRTTHRLINNLWTQNYAKADLSKAISDISNSSTPVESNLTIYITRPNAKDYLKLIHHRKQFRPDVDIRLVSSRVVSIVRDRLLSPYRKKLEEENVDELTAALLEGRDTPSSGLVAVFLMIQLCGKVTAYGFSGINDGARYHYWKGNRQYQNRTHSFSVERALLRRLAQEKFITFVDGNIDNIKSFV